MPYVLLVAEAAVLWRLSLSGLWRRYPLFAVMMAAGAVQHVASLLRPHDYSAIWVATTPALILLQAAAAWEIAAAWRSIFPRASGMARLAPIIAAVVGVLLARFSLPLIPTSVHVLTEIQRDASFAFALVLAGIGVFYVLPARHLAPRDLRIHTGLMVAYWAGTALSWTALAVAPEGRAWFAGAYSALRLLVLAGWAAFMRISPTTLAAISGPTEAEVAAQIEAIQRLR